MLVEYMFSKSAISTPSHPAGGDCAKAIICGRKKTSTTSEKMPLVMSTPFVAADF